MSLTPRLANLSKSLTKQIYIYHKLSISTVYPSLKATFNKLPEMKPDIPCESIEDEWIPINSEPSTDIKYNNAFETSFLLKTNATLLSQNNNTYTEKKSEENPSQLFKHNGTMKPCRRLNSDITGEVIKKARLIQKNLMKALID